MIRRVLLGIGGTPFSGVAIQRAVEAARQSGASLTAVTVLDEDRLSRVGPVPLGARSRGGRFARTSSGSHSRTD